jgi:hypothetical protein
MGQRAPCGHGEHGWLEKFGQADEWIFCLTAAKLPRIRSDHYEANPQDAWPWL